MTSSSLLGLWLQTATTGLDFISSFCNSTYSSTRIHYTKLVSKSMREDDYECKSISNRIFEIEECSGLITEPSGPTRNCQPAGRDACDQVTQTGPSKV
jgi:hypothetical protein